MHIIRRSLALIGLLALAACGDMRAEDIPTNAEGEPVSPETIAMYAEVQDGDILVPAIPVDYLSEAKKRQVVDYPTAERPGTIIVDPYARYLYHVMEGGKAALANAREQAGEEGDEEAQRRLQEEAEERELFLRLAREEAQEQALAEQQAQA